MIPHYPLSTVLRTALLHVGQAFGELALVAARKPRSRTVAASTAGGGSSNTGAGSGGSGRAGVHLVTLHRSALSHMRFVAAASVRDRTAALWMPYGSFKHQGLSEASSTLLRSRQQAS